MICFLGGGLGAGRGRGGRGAHREGKNLGHMLQRPGAGKGSPKQARCAASHQRVRLHHTPPRRRVAAANETSLREHPNPNHISWTDLQNFEPAEFLAPGALRADCAVAAAQWSEGNLGPHGGPRWLRAALADARAGAPPVCVAWVEHPLYLLFERWHRTNVWHGLEDVAHAFEASALWGWGTDAQAVVVEGLHDVTMFEGACALRQQTRRMRAVV